MIGGIEAFIDTHSAAIGLLILAFMFVEFVRERYPVSVVALIGAAAFLLFGLIDSRQFFGVFANPAPITIAAMFILSGALVRTGAIDGIASAIVARAKRHPRLAVVEVLGGALVASAFMNNTPVVVVLIPIMFKLAAATGTPVKRLLMPLSIVAVLGGTLTLVGTSTNLIVDGIAREQGLSPFGIFEITPYGLAAVLAGCAALALLGPWLIPGENSPDEPGDAASTGDYLTELALRPDSSLIGKPLGASTFLRRRLDQVLGVKRGRTILRATLAEIELRPGDRILLRTSAPELMTLRGSRQFEVGIARSADTPDGEIVAETMVSPSHPSIGGRLTDIPFFNRLRVRVLGVMRFSHLPGPDLANVRLRAADRLLVAGDPDSIRLVGENPHLMGFGMTRIRAFRIDKAPIAIGTLGLAITASALDIVPLAIAAILAVGAILLARCIDAEEAWASIDGDVLVLIFAMLAVGAGLEQSGGVAVLVDAITPLMMGAPPWALIFIVYGATLLLSELLSNNAVAAILTPLVIELALDMGTDPRPLVIALMIGASACFATPVGYQTNAMVYAAGNYRFADFVRIGVPLNIVVGLAACFAIMFLY